ncbi:MAG: MFS transporter, partial [Acidimicrobiia bacterium]|nr:MFS transporter [Acidimicrobiia bacterium]
MGATPETPSGWQPLAARPASGERVSFTASPFTRLARVQALASATDTLVALSLAGSLFFSIPTGEARGRVALYLLLTIAPFAIVGPLMGPALDRMKGGRRLLVVATGASRVLVCLLMARHLDSLLLFPEAFAALVLTKAYAIARSALVPTVVASDEDLVQANSKLSLLTGVASFVAAAPGALLLRLAGAEWV